MKRYHLIFAVASIAALFSCSKETASNAGNEDGKEPSTGVTIPENPQTVTLSASFETDEPEVKTVRDGKKVLWEKTDRIAVVAKFNDEVRFYYSKPAGADGASVEFLADVDSGAELLYAIYPAGLITTVPTVGESSVTVPVPATQDGTFANANITVAKIQSGSVVFRNICNLVKFTASSPVTRAQLCALDSRNIAGNAEVSFDVEGNISITPSATADRITLEGLTGAGTYYFATLPDETPWTGFGLRVGDASGYKPGIIGAKPFPKNTRGTVTNVGTVEDRIHGGDYDLGAGQTDVLVDLIASDLTSSTTRKNIAKAWRIHNKTINLAVGDYDMGKEVMVEFGGADEWVNVTIVGADSTSVNIVGGAAKSQNRRIMEVGNKTRLACRKITFKDAVMADADGAGFMFQNYNSAISFTSCRFTNLKNGTAKSGGVFKLQKPTVNFTNCTFDNNSAVSGGVYFQYEGTANFTKCKFENNTASSVGGVFCDAKGKSNFDSCVFKNCSAVNGGGAMASNDNDVTVTVKNSRFEACHSRKGGAIIAKKKSTTTLENVVFEKCYSDGTDSNPGGGALYILGEGSATINAKKCIFNGCYTLSNGEGGAYQLRGGTLNVEDSNFTGNYTTESKLGGVGHNWGSSTMSFTRCNFIKNISSKKNDAYKGTGGSSAGVHFVGNGATLKYTECVFDGNAASNASCFEVRANCYVAFDGCEFKNNEAGSTGVIRNVDDAASIVMVNNCSFHHNNQRNDDNAQIFNGGKTGQFFCYNTTIYGNTQSGTVRRGSLISTLGSVAIVSSTLIANSSRSVIQQNKNLYNVVALIMNSILLNENASAQLLIFGNDETTPNMRNGGYNIVAPQDPSDKKRRFTLGETDVPNANMSFLAGGQFNAETGKYMWNGPSAERSLASVDVIKTFLNTNLQPDNRNTNANITGKTNLGAEFVTWLESIDAFSSRPQKGLWPGAYQKE